MDRWEDLTMISRRVNGFVCLAILCTTAGIAWAEEPAPFEHVPSVTLPITVPRRVPRVIALASADTLPDPLRGTPAIKPETTGEDALQVLATLLPGRSDTPYDWYAPVEPLHQPCEPRALPPCVPPPPCHPSAPPQPYDLVGMPGCPSGGPIYGGPCAPRTGTPHHGVCAWYHRLHDRFFDHFYKWK
jgi:hypothetical protein